MLFDTYPISQNYGVKKENSWGKKIFFSLYFTFFAEKLLNLHVLPQQHELCNFLLQYHSLCTLLASKLGWKIHFKNINIYFSWYWEFLAFFPVKKCSYLHVLPSQFGIFPIESWMLFSAYPISQHLMVKNGNSWPKKKYSLVLLNRVAYSSCVTMVVW